nr:hypothetical protein [Butyrivibrio sp. AC2005]
MGTIGAVTELGDNNGTENRLQQTLQPGCFGEQQRNAEITRMLCSRKLILQISNAKMPALIKWLQVT